MKPTLNFCFLLLLASGLLAFSGNEKGTVLYKIDTNKSKVRWTGYYLFEFGEHNGTINLVSGDVQVDNNMISGGRFDLDMKTIKDLDMPQDDGGASLQEHLIGKDFFDADQFPYAQLHIIKTEKIKDVTEGGPNYDVFGEMTIKGITNPIKFPALITINDKTIEAKAKFKFDRTRWDVKYNSGRFLTDAGDGAISDAIAIDIELFASK